MHLYLYLTLQQSAIQHVQHRGIGVCWLSNVYTVHKRSSLWHSLGPGVFAGETEVVKVLVMKVDLVAAVALYKPC